MEIYFVSGNDYKISEANAILKPSNIRVMPHRSKIKEIQTSNTEELVRDKAIRAFKEIARPLFVEHTGLYLDMLNGLPGGLTQVIWDTLGKDRFSELFASEHNIATAKTTIGYIDGKQLHFFFGEIKGRIVNPPRHDNGFQWDCIFVPENESLAFSEMLPAKKNMISMRRMALEKFERHFHDN